MIRQTSINHPLSFLPAAKLAFDRGTLLLTLADLVSPIDLGFDGWEWDNRAHAWRRWAIDYAKVRAECRDRLGSNFIDSVAPPPRVAFPLDELPALRSEQTQALNAWRDAKGRGVIVMPLALVRPKSPWPRCRVRAWPH